MTTWSYSEGERGKSGWTDGLPVTFQPWRPACAWSLHMHSGLWCFFCSALFCLRAEVLWGGFAAFPLGGPFYVCVFCILIMQGRRELKCSVKPGINSALDFGKKNNVINDQLKWGIRIFCSFFWFVSLETGWCSGMRRLSQTDLNPYPKCHYIPAVWLYKSYLASLIFSHPHEIRTLPTLWGFVGL